MIRTGEDCRNSINDGRDVWINGARVDDPCSHPHLQPTIDVRARIYDMQHAAETQEAMTYEDGGERFTIVCACLMRDKIGKTNAMRSIW